MHGWRKVLRHRDLRLLFGLTISAIGTWSYNFALLAFVFLRDGRIPVR